MFKKHNAYTKVTLAGISNDTGLINPVNPFNLFGATPVMGSRLSIPCNSWLHKRVKHISIKICWDTASLPDNFRVYYKGYPEFSAFNNKSFLVNIVLLKNDIQYLLNQQPSNLFDENEGKILPDRIFSFNIKECVKQQGQLKLARFLHHKTSSYLRIILVGPESAFGHTVYSNAVMMASLEMLKDPGYTLPLPPYSPLVQTLEVMVS